ncbi:MAG TPA: FtsX-like permease family protein [Candidatus Dormibacteraeota bacterium]
MLRYTLRDLLRNPRRTGASLVGIVLAVGLFSGITLFVDASSGQMTARAIAPVSIDMQAGLTNPLASPVRLTERVAPAGAHVAGTRVTITLEAANTGTLPIRDAVLTEPVPANLGYQAATTQLGDRAIPDGSGGEPPLTQGIRLGVLAGGAHSSVSYVAVLTAPLVSADALGSLASLTSAGAPAATVGGPVAPDLQTLTSKVAAVSGVRAVDRFASIDLPAGSIAAGTVSVTAPAKLLGLDARYLRDFPSVRIVAGAGRSGGALVTQQVADALGVPLGTTVSLRVPGASAPLTVPVSGIVDFSQAPQLFTSRSPDTQGDFVATPYVVVIDGATFAQTVLPAARLDAAAATPILKQPPVVELHVSIDRSVLAGDPSSALVATQGLRRTIERVQPGDLAVVDNLSDALTAARTDAILAKVLLIALGLPGVLVAGLLARYAGGLLAESQRRERAILRARGAGVGQLLRGLMWTSLALTIVGTACGLGLGLAVLGLLVPDYGPSHLSTSSLVLASALSLGVAALTTVVALFLPSRRTLIHEVSEERRQLSGEVATGWLRYRLDLVLIGAAAVSGLVTYLAGGYKPAPAAEAQSVSLSFYVLLAPLFAWIGVTLLVIRLALWGARRTAVRAPGDPSRRPALAGLSRSVLRRPLPLASATIAVALTLAFGVSVTTFASTYQAEKLADARFVTGGDVRVTPSSALPLPASFVVSLRVPGVQTVTPLAQTSSAVVGTDKRTVVAIEPSTFASVAPLDAGFFVGTSPAHAMATLSADPLAVLFDQEISKTFNVQVGDTLRLQLPSRTTGKLVAVSLHAAGLFTNLPGFPQGVDFVMPLATYQALTGAASPDQFLLRTDGTSGTTATVAAALQSGVGRQVPLLVETTATAINRDQSSLAALSLDGLGRMEAAFAAMMAALAVAILVAGLLLQRRGEYSTLRALGVRMRHLVGMLSGEAGIAAAIGAIVGTAVGLGMAALLVQILRPLFTLPPAGITVPVSTLSVLVGLLVATTALATLAAGELVRRSHLVEVLREE